MHCQQAVTSAGRSNQVAHWADATDTRHDCRHLRKRPTGTELLEASKLGDVKVRVTDVSMLIKFDGDLGMSFDAGDGINNHFRHLGSSRAKTRLVADRRHGTLQQLAEA